MASATGDTYEGWDRDQLAVLLREHLLAGHLIDRSGMPQVISAYGRDVMQAVAIDEWMGASPIYTRRMQQTLGYVGDDVETMFKGLQFDIGSPPQFMDFRFSLDGPNRGEFWLASCGALMDVEPMGDDYVTAMCVHIEDPTFDATACAVNPRAHVRPIHRPPRLPADRHPHCHWTVVIDPDVEPVTEPEPAVRIGESLLAHLPVITVAAAGEGEGRSDYAGPLEDDVHFEDFTRAALVAVLDEVCLQGHLLTMAFLAAIDSRYDADAALEIGRKQFIGIAGLTASRLVQAFDLGSDLDAIATVVDLHPALRPRSYVDVAIDRAGDRLTISLRPCAALTEPRELPWPKQLAADYVAPLDAIVRGVNPRASCTLVPSPDGATLTWEVEIADASTDAFPEANEVLLTRFSTGSDFVFESRPRALAPRT